MSNIFSKNSNNEYNFYNESSMASIDDSYEDGENEDDLTYTPPGSPVSLVVLWL